MSDREPARPRRTRTACHTCHGQGVVYVETAAIVNGRIGTVSGHRRCKAHGCQDGWLEGIRPPA